MQGLLEFERKELWSCRHELIRGICWRKVLTENRCTFVQGLGDARLCLAQDPCSSQASLTRSH